jgi:sugar phosphate isomerase/epimerase
MIYLSTGLIDKKKNSFDTCRNFLKNGIYNVELSAGLYLKSQFKRILKLKSKNNNFLVHNYYPPSKQSFVINLASSNKLILKKSFNLAKRAINFSNRISAKYYSFHAGFLLDPKPNLLGKRLEKIRITNRDQAIHIFVDSIQKLNKYAKEKNVKLLIENNVITKKNLRIFKQNPLLMCDDVEVKKILSKLPNDVGLLLDVGHLNVSSKTLGFDRIKYIKSLKKKIIAAHLSENDGIEDLNSPIKKRSWFWKYIKNLEYYTLEIKSKNIKTLKNQIEIANKTLYE